VLKVLALVELGEQHCRAHPACGCYATIGGGAMIESRSRKYAQVLAQVFLLNWPFVAGTVVASAYLYFMWLQQSPA
jgi:hypothetical protein